MAWAQYGYFVKTKATGQIPLASTYSYHEALIYKYADYNSLTSLLVLFLLQAHLGAMKVQHLNMLTPKSQQIEPGVPIKWFQLHNQNSDCMNITSHAQAFTCIKCRDCDYNQFGSKLGHSFPCLLQPGYCIAEVIRLNSQALYLWWSDKCPIGVRR